MVLSNAASRLDTWIWVFVYAAIVGLGLGWAVARDDDGLGWVIGSIGILCLVVGMVMIWARSRIKSAP